MRTAIYARVSNPEEPIKFQVDPLEAYAKEQGYNVVFTALDQPMSGSSMDRYGLKRLLELAERGYFDRILVFRLDRFSNESIEVIKAMARFRELNVVLESYLEGDSSTALGTMMLHTVATLNQLEIDNLKKANGVERLV